MSESNSSSLWVKLLGVNTELFNAVGGLTGESFIDFKNIDVLDFKAGFLEDFWDGNSRANT